MAKKKEKDIIISVDTCPSTVAKVKFKLDDLKLVEPLTDNQVKFFKSYDQGDYFCALHGVAGTGKTFIALYKALQEVLTKGNLYHKVILIRSAVQGRDQGFLPGGEDEKMSLYEIPYMQIAHSLFGRKDAWDILKNQNRVEFMSTSFIRGVSWYNAIIIVDEMQNMTYSELQTIITRVGNNSKIIFCGDYRQTDLNKNKNDMSGIKKFLEIALLMSCHTRIEFGVDDIVRSDLVKEFIIAELKYEDS